jgi:RNA polymerase sigma-70 factor (ECF subfamily)
MNDPGTTRWTLIARLKNREDGEAWEEFMEIYTPVVYSFLRRSKLQDADANDVTQDVFSSVFRFIDRFRCEPSDGSFRGWLRKVTWSRLIEFCRRRKRQIPGSGDTGVHELIQRIPERSEDEDAWEQDYQKSVLHWAANKIRPAFTGPTWDAFWRTAINGEDAQAVAKSLDISKGAVYIAKSRVKKKLVETIRGFEDQTEPPTTRGTRHE